MCFMRAFNDVQRGYRRANDISGGFETGFGPSDLTIADTLVHRVLFENGRCTGMEHRYFGEAPVTVCSTHEMAPGPYINDEASLRDYVRETTSSYYHPRGNVRDRGQRSVGRRQ